jgi:hypothetical protein
VAEQHILGEQAAARPERRDQNGQQEREQRDHHPIIADSISSESWIVFSAQTTISASILVMVFSQAKPISCGLPGPRVLPEPRYNHRARQAIQQRPRPTYRLVRVS